MDKAKPHLAVPLVIAMLIITATFVLTQCVGTETTRMNARNACLSQAIELEKDKSALLQLVASGQIAYDGTVKDLLVDAYEIPESLDADGYAALENQIKGDADAIDAYLDGLQKGNMGNG